MINTNCPICNKAGLPDYTSIHTVCPQCNSDLKPFFLLYTIRKLNSKNKFLFVIIGVTLAALVFFPIYYNIISEKKELASENLNKLIQMQDSIRYLQNSMEKTNTTEAKFSAKEIVIQYKVKDGDCLSKIAQLFYDDWRMYKMIEIDNNLHKPYLLKIGQTLYIKMKQQ